MTVIFKDLDIEALIEKIISYPMLEKLLKIVKSNRVLVRLASICLVGLNALSISVVSTGITFGFEVEYGGKKIATVASASVYNNAKNIVVDNVNSDNAEEALSAPKFNLILTLSDKLDKADEVADFIIENTGDIVYSSALVINGETMAHIEKTSLNELLQSRLTAFYVEGAENTSSFVDDVEIIDGYYLKDDIDDVSVVTDTVNSLQVKTVATVTTDSAVPFSTQKVNTDTQVLGYYKVTTAGKNGVQRKIEEIETVNGETVSSAVVSDEVVTEPVTQVITIGTAPVRIEATESAGVSSAGFICPLPKGRFRVSAYFGDGRGHKAIDLSADRGTAIFAAAGGTVIYSGYDGDYGYCVVLDHGNGIKTRYAHASALCVNVGQIVSQGDMIAAVGSTGQSTGNHLHFEVIINGNRVNPAPYIGL